MNKERIVLFYLLMLLGHLAHIFEEISGQFFLIDIFGGLERFLVANWILFCVPVVFFYYVLREKRWAYFASMIYAGVMIVNGLGHNIATVVTGRYFGGFAGGFSGIGLIIIGLFLLYSLWKGRPNW